MSDNLYGVLGINENASEKEVTKAFRSKARVLHPDKQPPGASDADKAKACKAFQELVNAYEVLSDTSKRRNHDLSRPDPPRTGGQQPRPQQRQRQQQQQRPSSTAGARPQSASEGGESFGGERRASGGARRYEYWEDSDDEEEREREERRRRRKDAAEEEARAEARRRQDQEERDQRFEGLGSHWVKPPPGTTRRPSRPPKRPASKERASSEDRTETQTRTTPMPKTKVSKPRSEEPEDSQEKPHEKKKKRRPRSSQSTEDECSSDCPSDDSSVLSFDIHIDPKKYNFEPIQPKVDLFTYTEVWTIKQPGEKWKDEESSSEKEKPKGPQGLEEEHLKVIYGDGLPVTKTASRDSTAITKIAYGTIVKVLETAPAGDNGRIRARVEVDNKTGWITLQTNTRQFVKGLSQDEQEEEAEKQMEAKAKAKAAPSKPCCVLQ